MEPGTPQSPLDQSWEVMADADDISAMLAASSAAATSRGYYASGEPARHLHCKLRVWVHCLIAGPLRPHTRSGSGTIGCGKPCSPPCAWHRIGHLWTHTPLLSLLQVRDAVTSAMYPSKPAFWNADLPRGVGDVSLHPALAMQHTCGTATAGAGVGGSARWRCAVADPWEREATGVGKVRGRTTEVVQRLWAGGAVWWSCGEGSRVPGCVRTAGVLCMHAYAHKYIQSYTHVHT